MDGGGLADANLTDSFFSTSFIGVNGFGSPAETKYPMMQVIAVICIMFHLFQMVLHQKGKTALEAGQIEPSGICYLV